MALFDQLPGKYYKCVMNNLYISAKVVRAAWLHPKKIMVHGVVRETGKGVPFCVKQDVVTRKEDIVRQRWTLKVAGLEGDCQIPRLICTSLYDSKPFYMMTNACEELKWKKNKGRLSQGFKSNG